MSPGCLRKRARSFCEVSPVRTLISGIRTLTPSRLAIFAIPTRGDRRLRSTSAARAFRGDRYTTRHPRSASAPDASPDRIINLSRHHRNAVSVLPVPVGASISVDSPRAIAGHPSTCGAVGLSNTARNHFAVMGWNNPSAASAEEAQVSCAVAAEDFAEASTATDFFFGMEGLRGIASIFSAAYLPSI